MAWFGDDEPRDEGHSTEGGSSARLWPFMLTVFFGLVFAGIADLAWLTAIDTKAPWFTSTASAQVYTATLATGTLATLVLASLAASRLAVLDSRARAIAARAPSDRHGGPGIPVEIERPPTFEPDPALRGEGLDHILAQLRQFAEGPTVEVHRRPTGDRIEIAMPRTAPRPRPVEPGGGLPGQVREALRRARALVWQTVAGPLAVFILFIAIAGAMLPGSGGFAATHFQINTGLILFLGYGWPFLVAWTIAAIVLLHVPTREPSLEPSDARRTPRRGPTD